MERNFGLLQSSFREFFICQTFGLSGDSIGFACVSVNGNSAAISPPSGPESSARTFTLYWTTMPRFSFAMSPSMLKIYRWEVKWFLKQRICCTEKTALCCRKSVALFSNNTLYSPIIRYILMHQQFSHEMQKKYFEKEYSFWKIQKSDWECKDEKQSKAIRIKSRNEHSTGR